MQEEGGWGHPYEFENKRRHTKEERRGGRGLLGSEGDSWMLPGEEGERAAKACRWPEAPTGRDEGVQGAVT